ncbi:hypothetical protein [Luteibacter sp. UNCMF331Sha3.1]|uniref:hypothetical protein n=1 Tax=Luteibacter sp. UNCMF331Sha3.1 TaxID=1502760 RepID=UPI001113FD80|nr:hypothetical protein [Luteibacter sp. UNCMF331Sha3.1]
MIRFQRVISASEALAWKHGELLDFNLSFSLKADFLLRPARFIKPDDSAALREAKQNLLAARRRVLVRHALGAVFIVIGAFIGSFSAVAIARDY